MGLTFLCPCLFSPPVPSENTRDEIEETKNPPNVPESKKNKRDEIEETKNPPNVPSKKNTTPPLPDLGSGHGVKLPLENLDVAKETIAGNGLDEPWGVAISSGGNIIVTECGGCCVSIFSPAREKIKSFGSKGSSPGQFVQPRGVAVDADDNILVADIGNDRLQKFTSDGSFISEHHWDFAANIAIHPHNNKVYVTQLCCCITILNPNLTFSNSFSSHGSGDGQFNFAVGVAFDSTGNVYVVDKYNHRIQVFTAEGQFLRKFGRKGVGAGELYCPVGICIDSDNVIYVLDFSSRVSLFTRGGNFLRSFGSEGSKLGQFRGPCGIALDKDENIYVADTGNNRIQLF